MDNKQYIIIVATSMIAYLGYKFQTIKVPVGFENIKFGFKMITVFFKAISWTAFISAKLGFSKQPIIFQKLFNYLTATSKKNDEIIEIKNREINGIPIRIYSPKDSVDDLPVIIFYHGGGYVFGSVDGYNILTFTLAKELKINVISIEYRCAPTYKYPIPLDDCWNTTNYILNNPNEFKININRVTLAGDSAGGCIVSVITQRLAKENRQIKLQILIYPWIQHFDFSLPSYQYYHINSPVSFSGVSLIRLSLWYLGETDVTQEMENSLLSCEHTKLIEDKELKTKFANYLNYDLIPDEYKRGRSYYNNYQKLKDTKIFDSKLSDKSLFVKNKKFAKLVLNLFNEDASPALVCDDVLKKQPKTYMVICGQDQMKDDNLIFAERLRQNNVEVTVAYYDEAFHGIFVNISKEFYNTLAQKMFNDLVDYLKENI